MFAQELSPDFDVPGRREPGERPELVAEVGLVEVACAAGEVAPVDRSGGVDRDSTGSGARALSPGFLRIPGTRRVPADEPASILTGQSQPASHHAAGRVLSFEQDEGQCPTSRDDTLAVITSDRVAATADKSRIGVGVAEVQVPAHRPSISNLI
jgi:hypothetical protein